MTGKELRRLRKKRKMTQKELAEKLGLNQSQICSMETTTRSLDRVNEFRNILLEEFFNYRGGKNGLSNRERLRQYGA